MALAVGERPLVDFAVHQKQAPAAGAHAGAEFALVAVALLVDMHAVPVEHAVRPVAFETFAAAIDQPSPAVRPAPGHHALIGGKHRRGIVAGGATHPPHELAAPVYGAVLAQGDIGAGGGVPEKIEILLRMDIPGPDGSSKHRAGGAVEKDLRPLAPLPLLRAGHCQRGSAQDGHKGGKARHPPTDHVSLPPIRGMRPIKDRAG